MERATSAKQGAQAYENPCVAGSIATALDSHMPTTLSDAAGVESAGKAKAAGTQTRLLVRCEGRFLVDIPLTSHPRKVCL